MKKVPIVNAECLIPKQSTVTTAPSNYNKSYLHDEFNNNYKKVYQKCPVCNQITCN